MMKDKKGKGYAEGGMVTKKGPSRGSNGGNGGNGYTTYADKTKATPAKPL